MFLLRPPLTGQQARVGITDLRAPKPLTAHAHRENL
jgi:hypothetical protein